MAKRSSMFLGIGCLVVVAGIVFMALVGRMLTTEHMPSRAILDVRLDGPIVEISTDDPLSEILGEAPLSLRRLRQALTRAATDDRVVGVRLRIDSYGGGIANAQELRQLLAGVRRAGKWTAAYMDSAGEFAPGNFVYFLASACDEISINPMGDVNLIGLSSRVPFLRGTFDKLGIRPEFPGRGAYKTARFMFTNKDFTPAHQEMMDWLLDSITGQFVRSVAESRKLDPDEVRRLIDRGPFFGSEAVEAGLIDRLEDWTAFCDRLAEREEGKAHTVSVGGYVKSLRGATSGPRIAVVTATGAIMRGTSRRDLNPLFGGDVMGAETIAKAWRDVRRASGVKAAVFRIDSPGGSAVASEIIRQEMVRTAQQIPVVVSMSNVAGSGGYWITCGAQKIVADPATITASIGVYAGHLNMDGFWKDKLGVTFGRRDRGTNANIYGELEDWTDGQRRIVGRMLDRIYEEFVSRVSKSRHLTAEQVDAMGRGRVFTGEQALDKGLVDVLGGFDEAIAEAKELAGISPETSVRLMDFPKPVPLWQRFIKRKAAQDESARAALAELRTLWETGNMTVPGVVWMPPVYVR